MESSKPNRRVFLSQSAAVAACGAAMAPVAYAADYSEVTAWKGRVGSKFNVGHESLLLRSVRVSDHSADRARPKRLRPYSIALLFVGEHAKSQTSELPQLQHGSDQVLLTRVVPPEGESDAYYEGIIN